MSHISSRLVEEVALIESSRLTPSQGMARRLAVVGLYRSTTSNGPKLVLSYDKRHVKPYDVAILELFIERLNASTKLAEALESALKIIDTRCLIPVNEDYQRRHLVDVANIRSVLKENADFLDQRLEEDKIFDEIV